jgi:pimeloyl-ACP methyl ester carboxylesterase
VDVDTLDAVRLGASTQWIRVRGTNPANPVLLLVQQGPGLPMINEVARYERTLRLERDFTVVYWDQRGCGLSLRGSSGEERLSLECMARDTVEVLETLRRRFGAPASVLGFSLGATLAAMAATRRADLVRVLIAVGMDVDVREAAATAYDFALDTARSRGNRRAVRQLERIGPPPHIDVRQFSTRVRWLSEFGGVTIHETYAMTARRLVTSLLRSPDYSPLDALRTLRGMRPAVADLLGEMATIDLVRDLPRIDVPVVIAQGRLDRVSPADAAERYFAGLNAPNKELVWFEESAHTPQLDEPDAFRAMLLRVRGQQLGGREHVA